MQYALFYIDFFVNNIQKNHHLTALNGDFIIVCVTFLIIPFNRFSPFLPKKVGIKQNGYYCVNALYRASSIYTKSAEGMNNLLEESMPFIGLLPFLRVDKMILYKNVDESMPFIGLLPFLHKVSRLKAPEIRLSQCPLSGFFHFYRCR